MVESALGSRPAALGSRISALGYPIVVAPGALEWLRREVEAVAPKGRVVIVTDANVNRAHGAFAARALELSDSMVLEVPAGERHKTRETWQTLTDDMLARGLGRDTTVVALGGGVVGDLAGFVAATYMRGIPYVQVPTTLVAMVDASIGGKTGVDTGAGKNLVGAFHNPVAVVIDPLLLETLPQNHLRAGFAEVIKHGVVADAAYFDRVTGYLNAGTLSSGRSAELTDIIRRSVEIKSGIVAADEREAGRRKILNFGHTIGHAVEAASAYERLHGECVAIGMVVEAAIAERMGLAIKGTAAAIEKACRAAELPTAPPRPDLDALLRFTRSDKKARDGRVEYALPKRIGEMAGASSGWSVPVDEAIVREALA